VEGGELAFSESKEGVLLFILRIKNMEKEKYYKNIESTRWKRPFRGKEWDAMLPPHEKKKKNSKGVGGIETEKTKVGRR